MRRFIKSIDVDNIEKIDSQENKNTNIKTEETIGYPNNPSLLALNTLGNEKENKKLENDNLMNIYNNIEKKNDDDDEEDEYFKQPLMRVHRISIHSKDLGRLRRKLSLHNEKVKEKEKEKEREVSIDKELALKVALNYFGKRLKSFHGGRLNSERNRRNNSHSDYFNKNKIKAFNKNLASNRTRPNLKVYKDNNENEEIKNEREEKKEEEIKNKDKEENDDNKKNEEKRNEKNEDNKSEEDNIYPRKYRAIVNRKKYREKNNISNDEKEENSIDYHTKKNNQNDEEKEYLNFTEKKYYNNIGRRKFIINNSPRDKNGENEEVKNIISQRGKINIIYKKKDISKYYKEKEKEKEKSQNMKEILNGNNSQNPIRVRRYQRVGDGIDNNKNNEKRKEREVKKESRKRIEKLIPTPEKTGHNFYKRYRINNDNKEKENIHNISYKANPGLNSPNTSNSMIKIPIKLTNKVTNQIPLHKINKISSNNNNSYRSRIISETPKEKENITYAGYIRKILSDRKNLGSQDKDNQRIGVNQRAPLQININYSNSFVGSYLNKREEKSFENKFSRYNASSRDKKYENYHTNNYINTEGKIRINKINNIFDKNQNYNIKYDYKNYNKYVDKNINQNANKIVAKYVDRRSNSNNNNININLNNGYSTITASTVNRRRILIGKK